MKLEATHLNGRLYAVRPKGQLGTCGWVKGKAWSVRYITALSPSAAISKAKGVWS